MLLPSRTKYRKQHKGRINGRSKRGTYLSFGSVGLLATSTGRLSSRQIESARIVINKCIKRSGNMWIRIFPDKPITKKPAEVRMGKGKGAVEEWVAIVKPGRILYELDGIDNALASKAMKLASAKLPISTKVIIKENECI